jgi:exopolysaccharide biosynthesis polyprenyl glycosylphosphotransferase
VADPSRVPIRAGARASEALSPADLRASRVDRAPLLRRVLAVADTFAAVVAVSVLAVTSHGGATTAVWATVFIPVWLFLAKVHGLYDRDHRALRHLTIDEIPSIAMWATTGTFATALLLLVTPVHSPDLVDCLWMALAAVAAAFFIRSVVRFVWRRLVAPERTVLIGDGAHMTTTLRKLELFPDIHVEVVAIRSALAAHELDGQQSWLEDVDRVLVSSSSIDEELIAKLVRLCRARGIRLSFVPPARGMFGTAVSLTHVADLPVIEYGTWDASRSTLMLKRLIDVFLAALALMLLAPVMALCALFVLVDGGRPIFFSQLRVGLEGRTFRVRKFRTMVPDAEARLTQFVQLDRLDEPVFKLRDDPRVTRAGRLLRRLSLDELPQLINVLVGHMSLVGPRPEQVEIVDLYTEDQRFRLQVKPGLTGPMQVFGRGELTFEERLAVERDYIENLSLSRDFRIIAMTVAAVLGGRGAY